jgi:hypothetical protein
MRYDNRDEKALNWLALERSLAVVQVKINESGFESRLTR